MKVGNFLSIREKGHIFQLIPAGVYSDSENLKAKKEEYSLCKVYEPHETTEYDGFEKELSVKSDLRPTAEQTFTSLGKAVNI